MTQDSVSEELVEMAIDAWSYAGPDPNESMRAALNAIAPRLRADIEPLIRADCFHELAPVFRAQGMREAANLVHLTVWDMRAAILARADALDPPPQQEEKE